MTVKTTTEERGKSRVARVRPEWCILDEMDEASDEHLVLSREQRTAGVLFAAATHGLRAFVTFPRMLFTADMEEAGKTMGMKFYATLSSNPRSGKGTTFSLASMMANAHNKPEMPPITIFYDEIGKFFGASGLNTRDGHPLTEILLEGYECTATSSRSVSRVDSEYSTFAPVIMSGLKTSVPRDLRSRCIVIHMKPGEPRVYFDARVAKPKIQRLSEAVGAAVREKLDELAAFRALGLHPKLTKRKLEIWEPLLAVAYVLGGKRWLQRGLEAFAELTLSGGEKSKLTPTQETLRDAAFLTETMFAGKEFVGGEELADELRRRPRPSPYAGRSMESVAQDIARAMRAVLDIGPEQRRFGTKRVRGYVREDILDAWKAVAPPDAEEDEFVFAEEENPFAVTDVTDDEPATRAVTDGTDGTARRRKAVA